MNPKVSIVIPVYNGANYVREAIDSALAQTYRNVEILVVNDGSNDGGLTEEICISYGERIRYIAKPNGGVASALNLAVREMTGDYFSWLSHDDLYIPQKLEKQLTYAKTLGRKDIVLYSDFAQIDAQGTLLGEIRLDTILLNKKPLYSVLRSGISGCSLLIPRQAFAKTGAFDETLRTTQDYDLWFRMQVQGRYRFIHQPEVLIKSRIHAEQGTQAISTALSEANKLWIGFYSRLPYKMVLSCEESRIFFLQGMIQFLEQTPYSEAAEYYRRELQREQQFQNGFFGGFWRKIERYL